MLWTKPNRNKQTTKRVLTLLRQPTPPPLTRLRFPWWKKVSHLSTHSLHQRVLTSLCSLVPYNPRETGQLIASLTSTQHRTLDDLQAKKSIPVISHFDGTGTDCRKPGQTGSSYLWCRGQDNVLRKLTMCCKVVQSHAVLWSIRGRTAKQRANQLPHGKTPFPIFHCR